MPWISRPRRRRPAQRREDWRRWAYDHSEAVVSFWIGAVIVALVAIVAIVLGIT